MPGRMDGVDGVLSAKWVEQMQTYNKADVLMTHGGATRLYRCRHCQDDWLPGGGPYTSDHPTMDCPFGPRQSGWRKS